MKFFKSKKFKVAMGYLYGWGAAIVIVGALFKIQHLPGAGPMLFVGMMTEAFIFFMSAFEPPHAEPDWTLVYPELAGLHGDAHMSGGMTRTSNKKTTSVNDSTAQALDKLLEDAKIGPELIESLGKGFNKLSENTGKLADMSNATVVTNEYLSNVKGASTSVTELSGVYKQTSESLKKDLNATDDYIANIKSASNSASILADSYTKTSEAIKSDLGVTSDYVNSIKNATQSAKDLTNIYTKAAETLSNSANAIGSLSIDGKSFNEQLHKNSQNLSALNSMYELQMQAYNEQMQQTKKMQETYNAMVVKLGETAETSQLFKQELTKLTQNVTALNTIYGNMLTAMNFKQNL